MSADLMGDVWENSPAKGAELLVLLAIAYFADDEGFASETASTLAGKARMSTDSVYRAVSRLEEKGLLKVLQRGEGRTASRYQVLRSGRSLRPQDAVFELCCRNLRPQGEAACCRNLRPQDGEEALWPQSAATSEDASGRNLRPQSGLLPQSAATTDAGIEGTRAHAHARVGWLVGNTPTHPPTNPQERAHANASAPPVDEQAVDFMASLELKRTPNIDEQAEISGLFLAKIAAGFTVAEIRNSVATDWNGVVDRVRVLIARLKRMPDRPMRRPSAPSSAPQRPPECTECRAPVLGPPSPDGLCQDCRTDAAAADAAYRRARAALESVEPDERKNANAAARAEGLTDPRALEIRAAELLGEWNRLSWNQTSRD